MKNPSNFVPHLLLLKTMLYMDTSPVQYQEWRLWLLEFDKIHCMLVVEQLSHQVKLPTLRIHATISFPEKIIILLNANKP